MKECGIDLAEEHPDLQTEEEEHRVKNSSKTHHVTFLMNVLTLFK